VAKEGNSMKIAIIGAGNVGGALGSGWAREGHHVLYGVRDPKNEASHQLKAKMRGADVCINRDAARDADVVVFSTPWGATEAAVRECGDLAGKIVIDATNPLKADFSGLECGFSTSGGERVAHWARGAEVFKTMNQVGFGLMDHPEFKSGTKPVMFVAGDGAGKPTVLQLVTELGFEAIDVGGLEYARLLEPFAMLWIHLAMAKGQGRDFAFSLVRK
jgi:predicted dinucleotide-binding enzyme